MFSVLLLDIDDFKLVNDTYGHSTGDKVLQELGLLISNRLRNEDIFGRIGGEEFAIVLNNTPHDEAINIASRLCQAVEEHYKYCSVTVSVGVASVNKNVKTFKQLLNDADKALYQKNVMEKMACKQILLEVNNQWHRSYKVFQRNSAQIHVRASSVRASSCTRKFKIVVCLLCSIAKFRVTFVSLDASRAKTWQKSLFSTVLLNSTPLKVNYSFLPNVKRL
ncbi:GGDEF domain-containing protein [Vibrio parahaemolyticus]|nr:GGDEF domain-containing protein [Vibrio parahaemolyticus]MDN4718914.1 GGDEF domain-containing protein [Vibrio parahaemolyticus]MDN4723890.1 GGDEF domain-containing protein [Vibrio parahaemolyticus]MDN4726444.1 GGDEF domain-containing protein [Vibrio parahaemolyticus]MDN4728046.1 GGDEF domain-containing protein [Vibrio parahaemolyticus]